MTNIEEYLQTLTRDELCAIVLAMRRFTDDHDCPLETNGFLFDAPMRCKEECDSDIHLCWCKHFVAKYRHDKLGAEK